MQSRFVVEHARIDDDVPVKRTSEATQPAKREADGPGVETLAQLIRGEIDSFCLAGRYRVEHWLDRGGMASIYVGVELGCGRPVAIKILREDGDDWVTGLARFINEARLSSRIEHPNVVEVLDWGTTSTGLMYLVMELLHGEDLRTTLGRRGRLPWPRVRALMLELCAGLAATHRAGVVHRDLKPANCFRVNGGAGERLKLVDFGVAAPAPGSSAPADTRAEIVGTAEYMAPEQIRGERVDARADIYSAGVILAELLTGKTPFRAKTRQAVLSAQCYEHPPTLEQLAPPHLELDPRLELIYARALAKRPEDRFASIDEFALALEALPVRESAIISGGFRQLPERGATPRAKSPRERAGIRGEPEQRDLPSRIRHAFANSWVELSVVLMAGACAASSYAALLR